jgi:hypothetical protein
MSMTPLERILTFAVWALVACVFFYYRSLAIKEQQNHDSDGTLPKARSSGDGRP